MSKKDKTRTPSVKLEEALKRIDHLENELYELQERNEKLLLQVEGRITRGVTVTLRCATAASLEAVQEAVENALDNKDDTLDLDVTNVVAREEE